MRKNQIERNNTEQAFRFQKKGNETGEPGTNGKNQSAGRKGEQLKSKLLFSAAVILLLLLIGGGLFGIGRAAAYLTDEASVTNTFTIGNVEVELEETDWPGNEDPEVQNQVPFQETEKNPTASNTGSNAAVVFMKLTVPVRTLVPVSEDGTKGTRQAMELYYMKLAEDAVTAHQNHFADSWTELVSQEEGTGLTGNTRTYVFGYTAALAAGQSSRALFDKVQLAGFMEDEALAGEKLSVEVQLYAIQADNILENTGEISTDNGITKENLEKIYEIYIKQNND